MVHDRSHLLGWLAGGLVLAVTGVATAQQTTEIRTRETRTTTSTTTEVRRVTTVIGSTVRLQEAAQYGRIEDIVLNDAGCVEYIVIAHESSYVLVPWTVARVDYEERVVTVDTTPQQLETLIFTRDRWPNPSDPQFARRVQQVFGAAAPRREGRGGVEIRGREGTDRGTLRSRATDRDEENVAPDDRRPRAARPRAADRDQEKAAPDDRRPRDRDVPPRASDPPAPGDQPRDRDARPPRAADRPAPADRSGDRAVPPKAPGRGREPGDSAPDRETPKRPEEPPREPRY